MDAKSVDYARLVAVLIEAVKEQQKVIDEQNSKLALQQRVIGEQSSRLAEMEERMAKTLCTKALYSGGFFRKTHVLQR